MPDIIQPPEEEKDKKGTEQYPEDKLKNRLSELLGLSKEGEPQEKPEPSEEPKLNPDDLREILKPATVELPSMKELLERDKRERTVRPEYWKIPTEEWSAAETTDARQSQRLRGRGMPEGEQSFHLWKLKKSEIKAQHEREKTRPPASPSSLSAQRAALRTHETVQVPPTIAYPRFSTPLRSLPPSKGGATAEEMPPKFAFRPKADRPPITEEQRIAEAAEREEREIKKIEEAPYTFEGTPKSFAFNTTKAITDVLGLKFLDDDIEGVAQQVGIEGAGLAGMKAGMDVAKVLPHPLAKAAALPIGYVTGWALGKGAIKGEAPTPAEAAERAIYGMGAHSLIAKFQNLGKVRGALLGAAESAAIVEAGTQVRHAIETGKPAPIGTEEFYWRQGIALGLGGLMGGIMSGKPKLHPDVEYARFKTLEKKHHRLLEFRRIQEEKALSIGGTSEARAAAVAELKKLDPKLKDIESTILNLKSSKGFRKRMANEWMDTLDKHWSRWDKIAKNKTNERGVQIHARDIAKQLKEDIQLLRSNWDTVVEGAMANPEWFTRLAHQLRQAKALDEAASSSVGTYYSKGRKVVDAGESLKKQIDYLRAVNANKPEDMLLAAQRLVSVETEAAKVGRFVIESPKGFGIISHTLMHPSYLKTYYQGQKQRLQAAAKKADPDNPEGNPAWKLSIAMDNAINDGRAFSGAYLHEFQAKANALGFDPSFAHAGQRSNTRAAKEQFETFQRLLHTGVMPDGTKIARGKHVRTKKQGEADARKAFYNKKPWAFTKEEYAHNFDGRHGFPKATEGTHEASVRAALEKMEPVPKSVMKQYPKLEEEFKNKLRLTGRGMEKRGFASQLDEKSLVTDDILGSMNIRDAARLIAARRLFDTLDATSQELILGYGRSQRSVAQSLERLGTTVMDKGGLTGHIFVDEGINYFGINIDAKYLAALRNMDNPTGNKLWGQKKNLMRLLDLEGLKYTNEGEWLVSNRDVLKTLREKYESVIGSAEEAGAASSGTMGNLERARLDLNNIPPEILDMSFDGAAEYFNRAGKRLAEMKHYGQDRVANRTGKMVDNPDSIWTEVFEGAATHAPTKKYLENLKASAFEMRGGEGWGAAHSVLTGALIGNFHSAVKNMTGLAKIWVTTDSWTMGKAMSKAVRESLPKVFNADPKTGYKGWTKPVSEQLNIVGDNMTAISNLMPQGGRGGLLQSSTSALMKASGFTGAENFVRRTAFNAAEISRQNFLKLTAKADPKLLKEMIDLEHSLNKSSGPQGWFNAKGEYLGGASTKIEKEIRRLSEIWKKDESYKDISDYIRFYDNMDVNVAGLLKEGETSMEAILKAADNPAGVMEQTRKLYHNMVNKSQGGYNYAQLPQHMVHGEGWRFFEKFTSWTKQMQQYMVEDVIAPAMLAAQGNPRGSFKPLAKWIAGAQASGEVVGAIGNATGWAQRRDATYEEIWSFFEEGNVSEGTKKLLMRMVYNNFSAGLGSIPTEKVTRWMVADEQGWDTAQFSLGAGPENLLLLTKHIIDFNTHRDEDKLKEDVSKMQSFYRRSRQIGDKLSLPSLKQTGEERKILSDRREARVDLRGMAQSFRDENDTVIGLREEDKVSEPEGFSAGKRWGFARSLEDAINLGQADKAREIVTKEIDRMISQDNYSESEWFKQLDRIKGTVRARRPLGASGRVPEAHIRTFKGWIGKRNPSQAVHLFGIDRNYVQTAKAVTFTNDDGEVVSLFDTKAPPTETEERIYRATQAEDWNRRKAVALYENFMAGVSGGKAGKDMGELEAADLLEDKIKSVWGEQLEGGRTEKEHNAMVQAERRKQITLGLLAQRYKESALTDVLTKDEYLNINRDIIKKIKEPRHKFEYLRKHWEDNKVPRDIQGLLIEKMHRYKLLSKEEKKAFDIIREEEKK